MSTNSEATLSMCCVTPTAYTLQLSARGVGRLHGAAGRDRFARGVDIRAVALA